MILDIVGRYSSTTRCIPRQIVIIFRIYKEHVSLYYYYVHKHFFLICNCSKPKFSENWGVMHFRSFNSSVMTRQGFAIENFIFTVSARARIVAIILYLSIRWHNCSNRAALRLPYIHPQSGGSRVQTEDSPYIVLCPNWQKKRWCWNWRMDTRWKSCDWCFRISNWRASWYRPSDHQAVLYNTHDWSMLPQRFRNRGNIYSL